VTHIGEIMELETWKNIFQYLAYGATISVLVFSILTEVFTKKIQEHEKEKSAKIELERDNAIRKSNENAEALFRFNTFLGEIDNRVESCYLILDLGSTPLYDNFNDFSCYLYFEYFDILYQFTPLGNTEGLSDQVLFMTTKAVKGTEIKKNPFISSEQHNFKNISEIILDLNLVHKLFPKDLKIRDFFNTHFRLSITAKQKDFIKNIKLNVNHWNIFDFNVGQNNWKKSTEQWLDNPNNYFMIYDTYQTRHYESFRINYMSKGVSRYEIHSRAYENNLQLDVKYIDSMLKNVDPREGTLEIIIDNKWLEKNNKFINYFPPVQHGSFGLQIYRDIDNVLKIVVSNSFSNKITLQCSNMDQFSPNQDKHSMIITWGKGINNLYINGKPVDEVKGNN